MNVLSAGSEETTEKFTKKLQQHFNKHRKLISELEGMYADSLRDVSEGRDYIWKNLEVLFSSAKSPKQKELDEAQRRHSFGIQPGKYDDPIGDQLAWIQFCSQVDRSKKIFIVTRDRDYIVEREHSNYLHPSLVIDLKSKDGEIPDIECYRDITKAINAISSKLGIAIAKMSDKQISDYAQEQMLIAEQTKMKSKLEFAESLSRAMMVLSGSVPTMPPRDDLPRF